MNRRQALGYGAAALTGLGATDLLSGVVRATAQGQGALRVPAFGTRPEVLDQYVFQQELLAGRLPARGPNGLPPPPDEFVAVHSLSPNQFYPFQLVRTEAGPRLVDSLYATPTLETTEDKPDVALSVRLEAFHLGEAEDVDDDTRATLRLTIGEDTSDSGELLNWLVATGMTLYDNTRRDRAQSSDLQGNIGAAFAAQPIEIPGGIGRIKFEVMKHDDPPWWRRLFGAVAPSLITAFGFPAIVSSAASFLDDALNRFDDAELLFGSAPLKLAFSKAAHAEYTEGLPVTLGALSPGIWVLARGTDVKTLLDTPAYYHATLAKLVPASVDPRAAQRPHENPFQDMTYGVLNARMQARKIERTPFA